MEFYQAISAYYDEIFPFSDSQKKFLKTLPLSPDGSILDIGCGSGELALYLSDFCRSAVGIDLDPSMIDLARKKISQGKKNKIDFQTLDMTKASEVFPAESFDLVFCMGNTLPHLSLDRIQRFLRDALSLLKKGGMLVFQILNYEKILTGGSLILPDIATQNILFSRNYTRRDDGRLNFNGRLIVKKDGKVYENSVPLYPLAFSEINSFFKKLGVCPEYFGSFEGDAFVPESPLLIGKIRI